MAKLVSVNPKDGQSIGEVKITTKAEVEESVRKAKSALSAWSGLGLQKRGKILLKAVDLVVKNQAKLAEMISNEMGKPINESSGEVKEAAVEAEYLIDKGFEVLRDEVIEPKLTKSQENQMQKQVIDDAIVYLAKGKTKIVDVVRYGPVGVVAMIKPWNYPVSTVLVSLVPALLAGNTVVFKPSEYVSLVSQEVIKLFWQAGVPKNVLNLIFGRGQVGEMLADAQVDMVSFTGSSQVGQQIREKCAKTMKKCVLEMGGSSPAIVCRDADVDLAVREILKGRFDNCGQVCCAIKRVFVEASVSKRFIDQMVKKTSQLVVGDPLDKKTQLGPLVSDKQLKKLQTQVTKGVVQGGRILTGGRRMREEPFSHGFFHEPTVMTYVNSRNLIMQEETFGPVMPICVVDSLSQAIKQANNSEYGLTAHIFTSKKSTAERALKELEAGAVIVNQSNGWDVRACWSGVKNSGAGVELGKHGLWEYTRIKHMKVDFN